MHHKRQKKSIIRGDIVAEEFFDLRVFIIGILRKWRIIVFMMMLLLALGGMFGLIRQGNIAMYSLAGLAGGFVAGIVIIFFIDVMSTKIDGIREYRKIMRVGLGMAIPNEKNCGKFAFVDNWIDRIDGSTIPQMTADEALSKLCADVVLALGENVNGFRLCITGTVPQPTLSWLHSSISETLLKSGVECVLGGSLLSSADTVLLLKECCGILLVGQQGHSTRHEAELEAALIKSSGLGIVALAWVK